MLACRLTLVSSLRHLFLTFCISIFIVVILQFLIRLVSYKLFDFFRITYCTSENWLIFIETDSIDYSTKYYDDLFTRVNEAS